MSVDPVLDDYLNGERGEGGIFNSRNLGMYGYAAQNPVKYIDPDGNSIWRFIPKDKHQVKQWGKAVVRGVKKFFKGKTNKENDRKPGNPSDVPQADEPVANKPSSVNDKKPELKTHQKKAIRSLEKRMAEHEKKLGDFKENPTVRPGMEKMSKEVIKKQQQKRIDHLETEIKTFKNNIEKIKSGNLDS